MNQGDLNGVDAVNEDLPFSDLTPDNAIIAVAEKQIENTGENKDAEVFSSNNLSDYNDRKPRWWKSLVGKATKAQKRAMNEILQDHRLPRIPYGTFHQWETTFDQHSTYDIWLELGFGRGENLLALAHRKDPHKTCLIGAEIHQPGIATLCQRMLLGINSSSYWEDYVSYDADIDPFSEKVCNTGEATKENSNMTKANYSDEVKLDNDVSPMPYANLRIFPGDGVKLLPYLPSQSMTVILITFPDPFPQEKEKRWRVVQLSTLYHIHRVLRLGGRFFLATDHEGFHEWAHHMMSQFLLKDAKLFHVVEPCPDRHDWLPAISRYEKKGWDEGRKTLLSCWKKSSS